jgi:hypothetical protein
LCKFPLPLKRTDFTCSIFLGINLDIISYGYSPWWILIARNVTLNIINSFSIHFVLLPTVITTNYAAAAALLLFLLLIFIVVITTTDDSGLETVEVVCGFLFCAPRWMARGFYGCWKSTNLLTSEGTVAILCLNNFFNNFLFNFLFDMLNSWIITIILPRDGHGLVLEENRTEPNYFQNL